MNAPSIDKYLSYFTILTMSGAKAAKRFYRVDSQGDLSK